MIPEMEQGKYRMDLEHLVLPESKEMLKEGWINVKKDTGASLKELLLIKSGAI